MYNIEYIKNKVLNGDVLQELRNIPDESIDCIVTSPPYFGLRNYNIPPQIWGGRSDCMHKFNISKIKDPMDRNGNGDHDKNGLHWNKIDYKEFEVGYCELCGAWKGNLGLESHPQEYINHLVEIVCECMRVLKKSGVMFLNIGDSYGSHRDAKSSQFKKVSKDKLDSLIVKNQGNDKWFRNKQKLLIPHRMAIAIQDRGFIIRDDICWVKKLNVFLDRKSIGCTMPFPVKDKLLPATEYIFQIVKSEKYFFNLEDVKTEIKNSTMERAKRPLSSTYSNDVKGNPYVKHNGMNKSAEKWADDKLKNKKANPTNAIMFRRMNQYSKKEIQQHFASYPISLSDYFINIGCPENGIVLDPFMGSGTTGISALKQNKQFIGIELNPEYIKIAYKRLKPYLTQKKLT